MRTILIFILLSAAAVLSGCLDQPDRSGSDRISIVCTIFPQYDWVRQILGDKAESLELALLLENRIDLHNYQPSVDNIVKISSCDLFIYVGGESDRWVGDVLEEAANRDMIVINLLETLGNAAKAEKAIEGMEEDNDDEDDAYDEHVWLSLKNAQVFCAAIADALSLLDAENTDAYKRGLAGYTAELSALDAEYKAAVDAAPVKTLLFGDRFPFRYLMDDYGLSYYAAFPGCSAETDASFDTIVFLVHKMDELMLNNVMVTESADQSIARTIINSTADKSQRILVLDSMQSLTTDDVRNGLTYLAVMEDNLDVLKRALR